MAAYLPIPCVAHEGLEFAVLKRRRLRLVDRENGEIAGLPLDVYTKDRAEWLILRADDGQDRVIRLDHILSFREI